MIQPSSEYSGQLDQLSYEGICQSAYQISQPNFISLLCSRSFNSPSPDYFVLQFLRYKVSQINSHFLVKYNLICNSRSDSLLSILPPTLMLESINNNVSVLQFIIKPEEDAKLVLLELSISVSCGTTHYNRQYRSPSIYFFLQVRILP